MTLRELAIEETLELARVLTNDLWDGRHVTKEQTKLVRLVAIHLSEQRDQMAREVADELAADYDTILPQSARDYLGIQEKNDG